MSPELLPVLASSFVFGLIGSAHCVGMCGTGLAAISMPLSGGSKHIVNLSALKVSAGGLAAAQAMEPTAPIVSARALAWNAGRLSSYALAGALVGGLSVAIAQTWVIAGVAPIRTLLFIVANVLVIAVALQLLGLPGGNAIGRVELLGRPLWRRLQPLLSRTRQSALASPLPAQFTIGALWAWIPCGLVYTSLATAMSAGGGSASSLSGLVTGGAVMLAFGLGTAPAMLGVAAVLERPELRLRLTRGWLRRVAGGLLLALALINMQTLDQRADLHRLIELCSSGLTGLLAR